MNTKPKLRHYFLSFWITFTVFATAIYWIEGPGEPANAYVRWAVRINIAGNILGFTGWLFWGLARYFAASGDDHVDS